MGPIPSPRKKKALSSLEISKKHRKESNSQATKETNKPLQNEARNDLVFEEESGF
ncbi:hypothetical protein NC651_022257 [Populus alba x Populus x berolinensis]|nr:hypothetical protein NC651_022257 [Populus alba x Populus x berolinensis]